MLVLASASPRRQKLLRNAGIAFEVQPANIPEEPLHGEAPEQFARRLARGKALAVSRVRPADDVLGSDTIVVVGDETLGKPVHASDAIRMLQKLSGRTHRVITAVCLTRANRYEDTRSETTEVVMGNISAEEIQAYVASGEPMDKAGAYAIQGMASRWISRIDGCYFNVVGLPVSLVWRMLREHEVGS